MLLLSGCADQPVKTQIVKEYYPAYKPLDPALMADAAFEGLAPGPITWSAVADAYGRCKSVVADVNVRLATIRKEQPKADNGH